MCGVCVASSGNGIGAEGAKELAEGLSSNSTLQTLHLEGAYGGRGVGRSGYGRDGEGSGGADGETRGFGMEVCMWRRVLVSVRAYADEERTGTLGGSVHGCT